MMNPIPLRPLNDGRAIPSLGFGVYQISDPAVPAAVACAVSAGYRLIDTATIYGNERGVGAAVRSSGVPRGEFCITTKVWNDRHGFDATMRACAESLERLGLDHVDLYLIHWPVPRRDDFVGSWKALIRLREEGKATSIGVSNFTIPCLRRLFDETGVVPAVNQIEVHLGLQQRELRAFHAQHGIITESWSPLGQGVLPVDGVCARLARKYAKTTAQIALRWHLENGLLPIPKSATPVRIRENAAVFDFQLTPAEVGELAALDGGKRLGPDPDTFS